MTHWKQKRIPDTIFYMAKIKSYCISIRSFEGKGKHVGLWAPDRKIPAKNRGHHRTDQQMMSNKS